MAASFGRGIFILDDYTPLRDLSPSAMEQDALLFPTRRAWWYIEQHPLGFSEGASQGHSYLRAPNPPFGAVFTYYLKDDLLTQAKRRQEQEQPLIDKGKDTPYPSFETAEAERREAEPEIILTIRDSDGHAVRRVSGPSSKGIHRVSWDLRWPAVDAIAYDPASRPTEDNAPEGFLVAPGEYSVELAQRVNGVIETLAPAQSFEVTPMRRAALPGAEPAAAAAFWKEVDGFQRNVSAATQLIAELQARLELLKQAMDRTPDAPGTLDTQWQTLRTSVFELEQKLSGNQAQNELGTAAPASIRQRLGRVLVGTAYSTYGPTKTHQNVLSYAQADYAEVQSELSRLQTEAFPTFERALQNAGAPWTPGSALPNQ